MLIGIVLIQDEQGEGLGGLFGGGSSTPFGSRSGNVLTKATSVLGAVFLCGAFALAWVNKTPETGDVLGAARRGGADQTSVQEWWVIEEPDQEPEEAVPEESTSASEEAPAAVEE
jgi:preprotein translocase subunit SecG